MNVLQIISWIWHCSYIFSITNQVVQLEILGTWIQEVLMLFVKQKNEAKQKRSTDWDSSQQQLYWPNNKNEKVKSGQISPLLRSKIS